MVHGNESNLQNCNYAQKRLDFVAKIANTRLTKTFVANFALAERLPCSAKLLCSITKTTTCRHLIRPNPFLPFVATAVQCTVVNDKLTKRLLGKTSQKRLLKLEGEGAYQIDLDTF